jgi:NDP-sugar pyrophosphorylase family protein
MINILIPLGNASKFFEDTSYQYPKPLIEIDSIPMIQHVIENLSTIKRNKKFIFILRESDCISYHLDNTIKLLLGDNVSIIKISNETKGAVCSALLAIDLINKKNESLIIANGDQIFDLNLNKYIDRFYNENIDAGCLCIDSVHPRWSFVRLDGEKIIEAEEKNPISRNAISGFYFFRRGSEFVESAFNMIRKDNHFNEQFFVAPVLNELILKDLSLSAFTIRPESYHTFYSPQKIVEYELGLWKN